MNNNDRIKRASDYRPWRKTYPGQTIVGGIIVAIGIIAAIVSHFAH
jgi:hypothetical protein